MCCTPLGVWPMLPNLDVQEEGLEGREMLGLAVGLQRRMSTPLLLNYSPLDFMEQLSEGDAFSGEPFLYSSGAHFPLLPTLANPLHSTFAVLGEIPTAPLCTNTSAPILSICCSKSSESKAETCLKLVAPSSGNSGCFFLLALNI